MSKLLSIVISSKDNCKCLENLVHQIVKLPNYFADIDLFIINDGSTQSYASLEEFLVMHNEVKYIKHNDPHGKVKSVIETTPLLTSNYLIFIDDKDEIIPHFAQTIEKLKDYTAVFVGYLANTKMQPIGQPVSDKVTYYQYYYQQANIGDLLFFYPQRVYRKFQVPEVLKDLVINDELVVNQYIFNEPLTLINDLPLLIHDYTLGHLTSNIFDNKVNHWQVTRWCCNLIFNNNPCFKIKIVKLFEVFLTREKASVHLPSASYSWWYWILHWSGGFLAIKHLYKKKINELIQSEEEVA